MRFFVVRLLCPVFVLLALAGCDNYPDKWIAVNHPLFSRCPDISGTYKIGSNDEKGLGMSANMDDTFFRSILPPPTVQRWHWETMTITGDASQQLDITLMRSAKTMDAYLQREFEQGSKNYYRNRYNTMQNPATRWEGSFAQMTDDEYEANLDKLYLVPQTHHILKRDNDYECSAGWISSERLSHDPGPDRNNPRPDVVDGIVRFGKDKAGFLVAESIYREQQQFNVWCGDGCKGFSLGTWTMHDWRHWEPAAPAWQGKRPRPWAEPFKGTESAEIDNDLRGLLRLPEVRRLVTPTIVEPASLVSLDPSGKDVIMSVSSPTTDLFNTMFKGLGSIFTFYSVRVIELTHKPQGDWNMRMLLVLRPCE
jgi:hypothetical protein